MNQITTIKNLNYRQQGLNNPCAVVSAVQLFSPFWL